MQNGMPQSAPLPTVTVAVDVSQASPGNPAGVGIATNLPPWQTIHLLSEAIKLIAQDQGMPRPKVPTSKSGLVLPNGQPAPIDE